MWKIFNLQANDSNQNDANSATKQKYGYCLTPTDFGRHIRGGWSQSHYTDTSEPVDGNGA
jgi:hypothetical protein